VELTMNTVPNQKTIKTNKELCDKSHYYTQINLDALQYAMSDLKGEAFKLWVYLGKNINGYTFALSPVDAITNWGIGSKSSYTRAVKELIDKGYLVETSPNHYDFYELPKNEEIQITIHKAGSTDNVYSF
jgi:hypothetical protein